MKIEKMLEEERQKVLAWLLPYEKFSVTLYSEVARNSPSIYLLKGNFGEIHGVFSWWKGSSIHHCLPDVYGKNRQEMENAFIKFFDEMAVNLLFSVVGEKAGSLMLKKLLDEHFYKLAKLEVDYYLMENGRFDSQKNLFGMNTQLKIDVCSDHNCEKVYPLQVEFEKEEVVIEGHDFDEDTCRARFENFVDAGAVYAGSIKDIPLCKLTVNAVGANYVLLGGVYTLPKYRHHGLGKALVNHVTEVMKDKFKKCTLFVKVNNQYAVKLYQDCGFKKLCDFKIIYFK